MLHASRGVLLGAKTSRNRFSQFIPDETVVQRFIPPTFTETEAGELKTDFRLYVYRRRVLGVSCALSEAEVHWRAFLESLVARGLRGVSYIVSDDHPGLGAARKAVLGGATWQRCQFHLAQNAIHHAPNLAIKKAIGKELRQVWNARDGKAAEAELHQLVAAYREPAPKLAAWLERRSIRFTPMGLEQLVTRHGSAFTALEIILECGPADDLDKALARFQRFARVQLDPPIIKAPCVTRLT